jgi:hypothetical protein
MRSNTATTLRQETIAIVANEADMMTGTATTMMTSVAMDATALRTGAADMVTGQNAFMMTSVADL